jgi:predicted TIM-barrel fold metal-dependent hydrolase
LFDAFANLPVPVIADHIGGLLGPSKLPAGSDSDPINQAGYQSLLELAERQKVIVKVSGFYRASTKNETAYDDLEPIISSLAARVPDQLIWASDWPHTGDGADRDPQNHEKIEQFRKVDDAGVLKQLRQWFTCEAWRKMMVANPSRIYNAGGTVCN